MFIAVLFALAFIGGSILAYVNAIRIKRLKMELEAIKTHLGLTESLPVESSSESTRPLPAVQEVPKPTAGSTKTGRSTAAEPAAKATHSTRPVPKTVPSGSPKWRRFHAAAYRSLFSRADRAIARYWTGILGVIALVVGFSFLAILTALRVDRFPRFLMLIGVAALFFIAARLVRRRGRFVLFSAWFQSAAGALVLFACLGSAVIPWLRWVNSEPQGYLLLAIGILVNLTFALTGSVPWFASFHILISLAALAVAPASTATLIAAVFITGVCSVPALRRSWSFHLLIAETAYFAFVAVWYINHPVPGEVTGLLAAASLLAAFLPGFLTPYLLKDSTATPFGFGARAASWLYLGIGSLAFTPGSELVSAVLLLLAVAVYFLPRVSGRPTAPWLTRTDAIAALGLSLLAAGGLIRLEMDLNLATAIAYILTLLVSLDTRADRLTRDAAVGSQAALGILLTVSALFGAFGLRFPLTGTLTTVQATTVIAGVFLATAAQLTARTTVSGETKFHWSRQVTGILLSLLLLGLYTQTVTLKVLPGWLRLSGAVLLPAGLLGLAIHHRRPLPGFRIGLAALIVLAHQVNLVFAVEGETTAWGFTPRLLHGILLLAAAILLISFSGREKSRVPIWIGIVLAALDLMALSVSLTRNLDESWWILLWALLGLAAYAALHAFSRRLREDARRPVEITGIAVSLITVAFLIILFLNGIIATTPMVLRLATETLSILGLVAWAWRPLVRSREASRTVWSALAVAGACIFLALEVPEDFVAFTQALSAVLILTIATRGPYFLHRLKILSLVPWAAGLFATIFYTGGRIFLDVSLFSPNWWLGLAGAAAALVYIAFSYILDVDATGPAERFIRKHRHQLLFLPWFATAGIFFVFSFDGPALTTLLIAESFALFALGILLKEPLFRPFSYALLAYCLFRLVFTDMAEADTLERALVFIVSGALLLGMNWIYNRFGQEKVSQGDEKNSTAEKPPAGEPGVGSS